MADNQPIVYQPFSVAFNVDLSNPKNPFSLFVGGLLIIIFILSAILSFIHKTGQSSVVLLNKPEKDVYVHEYLVILKTSLRPGSRLTEKGLLKLQLFGSYKNSAAFELHTDDITRAILRPGNVDIFVFYSTDDLGDVRELHLTLMNWSNREMCIWRPCYVEVIKSSTSERWGAEIDIAMSCETMVDRIVRLRRGNREQLSVGKTILLYHPLTIQVYRSRFGCYTNFTYVVFMFFYQACLMVGTMYAYITGASYLSPDGPGTSFNVIDLANTLLAAAVTASVVHVVDIMLYNVRPMMRTGPWTGMWKPENVPRYPFWFEVNYDWDKIVPPPDALMGQFPDYLLSSEASSLAGYSSGHSTTTGEEEGGDEAATRFKERHKVRSRSGTSSEGSSDSAIGARVDEQKRREMRRLKAWEEQSTAAVTLITTEKKKKKKKNKRKGGLKKRGGAPTGTTTETDASETDASKKSVRIMDSKAQAPPGAPPLGKDQVQDTSSTLSRTRPPSTQPARDTNVNRNVSSETVAGSSREGGDVSDDKPGTSRMGQSDDLDDGSLAGPSWDNKASFSPQGPHTASVRQATAKPDIRAKLCALGEGDKGKEDKSSARRGLSFAEWRQRRRLSQDLSNNARSRRYTQGARNRDLQRSKEINTQDSSTSSASTSAKTEKAEVVVQSKHESYVKDVDASGEKYLGRAKRVIIAKEEKTQSAMDTNTRGVVDASDNASQSQDLEADRTQSAMQAADGSSTDRSANAAHDIHIDANARAGRRNSGSSRTYSDGSEPQTPSRDRTRHSRVNLQGVPSTLKVQIDVQLIKESIFLMRSQLMGTTPTNPPLQGRRPRPEELSGINPFYVGRKGVAGMEVETLDAFAVRPACQFCLWVKELPVRGDTLMQYSVMLMTHIRRTLRSVRMCGDMDLVIRVLTICLHQWVGSICARMLLETVRRLHEDGLYADDLEFVMERLMAAESNLWYAQAGYKDTRLASPAVFSQDDSRSRRKVSIHSNIFLAIMRHLAAAEKLNAKEEESALKRKNREDKADGRKVPAEPQLRDVTVRVAGYMGQVPPYNSQFNFEPKPMTESPHILRKDLAEVMGSTVVGRKTSPQQASWTPPTPGVPLRHPDSKVRVSFAEYGSKGRTSSSSTKSSSLWDKSNSAACVYCNAPSDVRDDISSNALTGFGRQQQGEQTGSTVLQPSASGATESDIINVACMRLATKETSSDTLSGTDRTPLDSSYVAKTRESESPRLTDSMLLDASCVARKRQSPRPAVVHRQSAHIKWSSFCDKQKAVTSKARHTQGGSQISRIRQSFVREKALLHSDLPQSTAVHPDASHSVAIFHSASPPNVEVVTCERNAKEPQGSPLTSQSSSAAGGSLSAVYIHVENETPRQCAIDIGSSGSFTHQPLCSFVCEEASGRRPVGQLRKTGKRTYGGGRRDMSDVFNTSNSAASSACRTDQQETQEIDTCNSAVSPGKKERQSESESFSQLAGKSLTSTHAPSVSQMSGAATCTTKPTESSQALSSVTDLTTSVSDKTGVQTTSASARTGGDSQTSLLASQVEETVPLWKLSSTMDKFITSIRRSLGRKSDRPDVSKMPVTSGAVGQGADEEYARSAFLNRLIEKSDRKPLERESKTAQPVRKQPKSAPEDVAAGKSSVSDVTPWMQSNKLWEDLILQAAVGQPLRRTSEESRDAFEGRPVNPNAVAAMCDTFADCANCVLFYVRCKLGGGDCCCCENLLCQTYAALYSQFGPHVVMLLSRVVPTVQHRLSTQATKKEQWMQCEWELQLAIYHEVLLYVKKRGDFLDKMGVKQDAGAMKEIDKILFSDIHWELEKHKYTIYRDEEKTRRHQAEKLFDSFEAYQDDEEETELSDKPEHIKFADQQQLQVPETVSPVPTDEHGNPLLCDMYYKPVLDENGKPILMETVSLNNLPIPPWDEKDYRFQPWMVDPYEIDWQLLQYPFSRPIAARLNISWVKWRRLGGWAGSDVDTGLLDIMLGADVIGETVIAVAEDELAMEADWILGLKESLAGCIALAKVEVVNEMQDSMQVALLKFSRSILIALLNAMLPAEEEENKIITADDIRAGRKRRGAGQQRKYVLPERKKFPWDIDLIEDVMNILSERWFMGTPENSYEYTSGFLSRCLTLANLTSWPEGVLVKGRCMPALALDSLTHVLFVKHEIEEAIGIAAAEVIVWTIPYAQESLNKTHTNLKDYHDKVHYFVEMLCLLELQTLYKVSRRVNTAGTKIVQEMLFELALWREEMYTEEDLNMDKLAQQLQKGDHFQVKKDAKKRVPVVCDEIFATRMFVYDVRRHIGLKHATDICKYIRLTSKRQNQLVAHNLQNLADAPLLGDNEGGEVEFSKMQLAEVEWMVTGQMQKLLLPICMPILELFMIVATVCTLGVLAGLGSTLETKIVTHWLLLHIEAFVFTMVCIEPVFAMWHVDWGWRPPWEMEVRMEKRRLRDQKRQEAFLREQDRLKELQTQLLEQQEIQAKLLAARHGEFHAASATEGDGAEPAQR